MSTGASDSSGQLHVLMMPDYRVDNPYQSLLSKALESQGVQVHFPWGYRRVCPISRAVKTSKQSFDVVHLHWLDPYIKGERGITKLVYALKFLVDVSIARLLGVRVIWTVHNQLSHNTRFPKLELWTNRMLVKLVDRIIVHNSSALDYVAKEYWSDISKAEIVPHGHYREVYGSAIDQVEARKELGLPLIGRIYLNLGMLRPYKGLERLLKIWSENREILAGDTLLIAGKALDEAYGLKLSQLAAQTKGVILYSKFVEENKMHLFFSAADVVVFPFENILTSGSLILAMSYGKPIIAPRLGGIPETIGVADSLLYDSEDDRGLLHALKKSTQVDLSELSQLVTQACAQLDWSKIGQKTSHIY